MENETLIIMSKDMKTGFLDKEFTSIKHLSKIFLLYQFHFTYKSCYFLIPFCIIYLYGANIL